jgi:hypothetical protein
MNNAGKGSSPRPFSVSDKQFQENFDRIFKGKNDKRIHNRPDEAKHCNGTTKTEVSSKQNDKVG